MENPDLYASSIYLLLFNVGRWQFTDIGFISWFDVTSKTVNGKQAKCYSDQCALDCSSLEEPILQSIPFFI